MKHFRIICFVLFSTNAIIGQTTNQARISYTQLEIITFSVKFSYSTNGNYKYSNSEFSYQGALQTLQARYDYYHALVSTEYFKLKDLYLVNQQNQNLLQQYKNERLNWIYNAGRTWDLGNPENANNILNYCTEIYSYSSIKAELLMLKAISQEISLLKLDNPNNYFNSQRYTDIGRALEELSTCSSSDIASIAWQYGLGGIAEIGNLQSEGSSSNFKTYKFGNKFWLSQNLQVKKFRNGGLIQEAGTNDEWNRALKNKSPAWCYYENDPRNEWRGLIYNWYAVNDSRGLAPKGYHVATKKDWEDLELSLGGGKQAVIALLRIEDNEMLPYDPNKFLLSGQARNSYTTGEPYWSFENNGAEYWTSTLGSTINKSYYWRLFYVNRTDGGYTELEEQNNNGMGLPVRCVRD